MNECQYCKSVLVDMDVAAGKRVRCANCAELISLGVAPKVSANRLAWRSLYLGLASFVFFFITGIPAVYYGVKSLMRMRFTPMKQSDQNAAIAGTALGGCVGIFFGTFVALVALAIVVIFATRVDTEDKVEVELLCAKKFVFQQPEFCNRFDAERIMNSWKFNFRQQDEQFYRWFDALLITEPKMQPTFSTHFTRIGLNRGKREMISTEILKWQFCGEEVDVTKEHEKVTPPEDSELEPYETYHYYMTYPSGGEVFGISILFCPDKIDFDEEDAKALAAATTLANGN